MRALKHCLWAVVAAGAFLGGYAVGYRHGVDDTLPPPKFEAPEQVPVRSNSTWSGLAGRTYRMWKKARSREEQLCFLAIEEAAAAAFAVAARK